MAAVPYTTLQDILEEAGLSHVSNGDELTGAVDGVNKQFTTAKKPLSDTNYDDVVNASDVRVYVNGVPVEIESIDVQFGIITLVEAPALDAEVTADYRYSPVSIGFAEKARASAEAWINRHMRSIDSSAPYTSETEGGIPEDVRYIAILRAAGKLQIRDYGYNQDTEGTSKDGYKKLSTAKSMLKEFAAAGGVSGEGSSGGDDGHLGDVSVQSEGSLFDEPRFSSLQSCDGDW